MEGVYKKVTEYFQKAEERSVAKYKSAIGNFRGKPFLRQSGSPLCRKEPFHNKNKSKDNQPTRGKSFDLRQTRGNVELAK